MTYTTDAVVIDLPANAIRIRVPGFQAQPAEAREATLDVGANGRLVGIEIGDDYVSVMDLPNTPEPYLRSANIQIGISAGTPPYISIPRRGASYEITYPSGNECWQMKSVGGELIQVCATIEGAPGALRDARGRSTDRHRS
jgi:hypothetical protein